MKIKVYHIALSATFQKWLFLLSFLLLGYHQNLLFAQIYVAKGAVLSIEESSVHISNDNDSLSTGYIIVEEGAKIVQSESDSKLHIVQQISQPSLDLENTERGKIAIRSKTVVKDISREVHSAREITAPKLIGKNTQNPMSFNDISSTMGKAVPVTYSKTIAKLSYKRKELSLHTKYLDCSEKTILYTKQFRVRSAYHTKHISRPPPRITV